MEPEMRIIDYDVPSTPTTSRSAFMRNRRRSTPHMVTFLRKEGIAKELMEFEHDEQHETSSSIEADTSAGSTSQMTSDDSGIDVSQANPGTPGHCHYLRKRYKISY